MPPTWSASGRFKRTNGPQKGAREGAIGGKFVIASRMQTIYPRSSSAHRGVATIAGSVPAVQLAVACIERLNVARLARDQANLAR